MTIRARIPLHGPEMMAGRAKSEVVRTESKMDLQRRLEKENGAVRIVRPDPRPEPHRGPIKPLTEADLNDDQKAQIQKLKKATEQIEAIFVKDLLSQMRRGVSGQEKGDAMGDMAKDMMDQAVADDFGRTGGIGIGRMLYRNLADAYLKQETAKKAVETHEEGNGK